jgi:hypothetical protein
LACGGYKLNRRLGRPQNKNGYSEGEKTPEIIFKNGSILNQTENEKTNDKFHS